jgi:hypothetical protein
METGRAVRELSVPVTGWRAWTVVDAAAGLRLGSVLHDLVWPLGQPVVAECRLEDDPFATPMPPHPVPGPACNCGFHAARDAADALSYARGRDEPGTLCRILGQVTLWGHVLETETGWRASHAYPVRLYVADRDIGRALDAYSVPVCGSRSSPTCTATPSRFAPSSTMWRASSPT